MKYVLMPVKADFIIDTTWLEIKANEKSLSTISVDVEFIFDNLINEKYQSININFSFVSKLEFNMLNFWKYNYELFDIVGDEIKLSSFYYVVNSPWDKKEYDPSGRFNLAHFILIGNDSYVELLANKEFTYEII